MGDDFGLSDDERRLRDLVREIARERIAPLAAHVDEILYDRALADRMAANAVTRAGDYRWSTTAARLRRLYADLTVRTPVSC